jgi:hypothetical protein
MVTLRTSDAPKTAEGSRHCGALVNVGLHTYVVIADYQVLTDRETRRAMNMDYGL